MNQYSKEIISCIETLLPKTGETYPLHEPCFEGNEKKYVCECIDTGWVSSVGSYVDNFEKKLAEVCETKYAIATVNGTSALNTALILAGTEQDTETIIPSLTFVATANAVSYLGSIPHMVDSSPETLGIDPEKLANHLKKIAGTSPSGTINRQTGRKIAAIIPVHVFGHPVDMDPLLEIAEQYEITIIEDAAESLGSTYKGRPAGSMGKLAALSFNGNKIATTGGGGAILTNDKEMAERAKHLTTTAKAPLEGASRQNAMGYNHRMPNINAAIGCAQLEQLDSFLKNKRNLASLYEQAFAGCEKINFFHEPQNTYSNYWLNAITIDESIKSDINEILGDLNGAGYLCRPIWKPMHKLSIYKDLPRTDMSVAESLENRIINLPSSAKLGAHS